MMQAQSSAGRLTAREIAGLPGLPATAAGVEALARSAGWTAKWEGAGAWSYAVTDVFDTAFSTAAAEKDRLDRELCDLAAALAILWVGRPAAPRDCLAVVERRQPHSS